MFPSMRQTGLNDPQQALSAVCFGTPMKFGNAFLRLYLIHKLTDHNAKYN